MLYARRERATLEGAILRSNVVRLYSLAETNVSLCANKGNTHREMRLLDMITLKQSHPQAQQHRYKEHRQKNEVSNLVKRCLQRCLADLARHSSRSDE